MAVEIERKFLVINDEWRALGQPVVYRQGYLLAEPHRTVRVRVAGDRAYLTFKGATAGVSRQEFEYPIPLEEAETLLGWCDRPLIEKTRTAITLGDLTWEVDEFMGDNAGLILAEVELPDAGYAFERPEWIGKEVSDDPRYFNANLIRHPYGQW